MSTNSYFLPVPSGLSADQHQRWLFRQRTAESTLEIQISGGTVPNDETIAHFRRYVAGEIPLSEAIAQVREQMAQEHPGFRQYLNGLRG